MIRPLITLNFECVDSRLVGSLCNILYHCFSTTKLSNLLDYYFLSFRVSHPSISLLHSVSMCQYPHYAETGKTVTGIGQ